MYWSSVGPSHGVSGSAPIPLAEALVEPAGLEGGAAVGESGAGTGADPLGAPVKSAFTLSSLPPSTTTVSVHDLPTVSAMRAGVHVCEVQSKVPSSALNGKKTLASLTLAPLKLTRVQPRVSPEVIVSSAALRPSGVALE